MKSNGKVLSKQEIARRMAENAEKALLISTDDCPSWERGLAHWRVGRLLREISKLGLKYQSVEAQTA